jgi:two-component system response regulator
VLLVDANSTDPSSLARGIEHTGLNIFLHSVASVPDAIDYLNAKQAYADRSIHPYPDLLLLDLDIPIVTYLDFLQWHRGSAALSLPVIILGSPRFKPEMVKGTLGGAADYIPKPPDSEGWIGVAQQLWAIGRKLTSPEPE